MKHALLWKRILNEGLDHCEFRDNGEEIEIIKSPIISLANPQRFDAADFDARQYVGQPVSMPFDSFWMEFGQFPEDSACYGALVKFSKEKRVVRFVNIAADCLAWPNKIGECLFWLDEGSSVTRLRDYAAESRRNYELNLEIVSYVMGALALLSCGNVSLAQRDNEPKQVRRATKRHGLASCGYRYHVLMLRPPGTKAGSKSQEIGSMPFHVCRGHFQHYGPAIIHRHPDGKDRGLLFGKIAGRFYVQQSVRGDKKNGIVEKDYEIAVA